MPNNPNSSLELLGCSKPVTNQLIYLTLLCCVYSIQSFELPVNISIAIGVLERVAGHVPKNDTKVQEFANILDYFVKCTLLEKQARQEVDREKNSNSTDDGDQDWNITLPWQEALNEALDEENITTKFNKTLQGIIEHLDSFITNPKNDTPGYLQLLSASRKSNDEMNDENLADYEDYPVTDAGNNSFWDVTLTRRIYGGKRTKIKRFPFLASVMIFNTFACAGTIIKADLIITAASCLQLAHNNRFFRENPSFLSVRVGSTFMKVGGDVVPVMEVYFYPTYDPKTLRNNVAIMRLLRLLNFRHRSVKKIDFDRSASALPENTPGITIIGWGAKTKDNKVHFHARLHAIDLDYYDIESCREIYGKTYVTKTNFCAGFISRGEGACNHDVGDPGVTGRYLMGVTSFGSPICGQVDTPTVFTKLGYYTDWIEEIMEQKVPRIRLSTTTRVPFYVTKPIQLLAEKTGEHLPITVQRNREDKKNDKIQPIETKVARQDNYRIAEDQDPELVDQPGIEYNQKNILAYQEASKNAGRSKIVDADPEIELTEIQGESPYNEVESDNTETDNYQSDEDDEKQVGRFGQGMNANGNSEMDYNDKVRYTTAMVDVDPVQRYSDIENVADPAQQDTYTDIDGRTSEPETNDSSESASMLDIADSTKRPVKADIGDMDSAGGLSNVVEDVIPHMGINGEEDFAKTNDNNSDDDEVTDKNENYNSDEIESTTKNKKVLSKNIQSITHVNTPIKNVSLLKNKANQIEEVESKKPSNIDINAKLTVIGHHQEKPIKRFEIRKPPSKPPVDSPIEDIDFSKVRGIETNNNITNHFPNTDESNESSELTYGRKHTAKRLSIPNPDENEESKLQSLPQSEITEDAVKIEIQKLIAQLQKSNEDLSEEDEPTNSTPLRNLLENMDADQTKTSDTVFTFLYLSDSEKKPRQRADGDQGGGLSIDTEAFRKQLVRVRDNNFINKSEIYGIFADVMNTVANKTMM